MRKRKLQGRAIHIEKTGQFKTDDEDGKWKKCIFTVALTKSLEHAK